MLYFLETGKTEQQLLHAGMLKVNGRLGVFAGSLNPDQSPKGRRGMPSR